jgi:murein DD-endopeptidase MepM/ murein hydrolase activator NlpD
VLNAGGWPTARHGKIIGVPHAGTHNLGNWQSDNAIDIAVPNGTPILASTGGRIVKVRGSYHGGSSRFDGFQVTIQGPDGGLFYTHLSRVNVKPGQKVKTGQVIGRSGSANGVPHLHFGAERGDPRRFVG